MNATQVTIAENTGDYIIFSSTPTMFTAVSSGNGFLLQNGSNYLYGTSSGGTSLRVGTTQMVWTTDASANPGFSDGKYYTKEDSNSVWLMNADGGYNWSIKYETAGSFGYDRDGRDNTYSTGFVSFILYEYVGGEEKVSPIVDTSDATATASDMASGKTAYVKGQKITGTLSVIEANNTIGSNFATSQNYEDSIFFIGSPIIHDMVLRTGSKTAVLIPYSEFGNASASDVLAGKTFTSSTGLKVTGTASLGTTPTGTREITENGTYDVTNYATAEVRVPEGNVIKTGTTTSTTIATGLSSIEEFFMYKTTQTATGLIRFHYSKTNGTSYMYASAWSTSTYGTKTITNATTAATVSGGSITLPSSTATSGGLSSGVTYTWIAVGKE